MTVITLETLVLRGVAVLRDELAINLRLGTGAKVEPQTPTVRNSMRHPSLGCWPAPANFAGQAAGMPDHANPRTPVDYRVEGVMPGAGRSRSRAGVPSRRPAINAGPLTSTRWCGSTQGGPQSTAAASWSRNLPAGVVAPVSEGPSGRRLADRAQTLPRGYHRLVAGTVQQRTAAGLVPQCELGKRASRTPPGSATWGLRGL
jgi:hypothetical protein